MSGSGRFHLLAPGTLDQAHELDSLRKKGQVLGPLYSTSILVKVCMSIRQSNHPLYTQGNIATPIDCGMGTTSGAVALIGFEPNGALIVDKISPIQSDSRTSCRLFLSAGRCWRYHLRESNFVGLNDPRLFRRALPLGV